ncbi:MAG: hypothetical protein L6R35_004497 [Caloplaca aegaea]|nr:MAG: hypothetical protein L6R35_004497 [Caloplaca aegaea]
MPEKKRLEFSRSDLPPMEFDELLSDRSAPYVHSDCITLSPITTFLRFTIYHFTLTWEATSSALSQPSWSIVVVVETGSLKYPFIIEAPLTKSSPSQCSSVNTEPSSATSLARKVNIVMKPRPRLHSVAAHSWHESTYVTVLRPKEQGRPADCGHTPNLRHQRVWMQKSVEVLLRRDAQRRAQSRRSAGIANPSFA